MEDESILNRSTLETQTYLNDLAIAVCVNGDKLEKYEKVTTRQCGEEAFANMKLFVEEVQRSVERGKFTNTSKVNLGYLGKNAGVSDETITMIVEKCAQRIKIDPQKEENEFWLNCKTLQDYKAYLDKYPNGTYRNSAQTKIDELERFVVRPLPKESDQDESPSWGLNIVSFLFPFVGWVLFFALQRSKKGKACAKWACFGCIFFFVLALLL
jgi:hypothetical protein